MKEYTYIFTYVVGNTYKVKIVRAKTIEQAWKKARLGKSVVNLDIFEYQRKDEYLLRDF